MDRHTSAPPPMLVLLLPIQSSFAPSATPTGLAFVHAIGRARRPCLHPPLPARATKQASSTPLAPLAMPPPSSLLLHGLRRPTTGPSHHKPMSSLPLPPLPVTGEAMGGAFFTAAHLSSTRPPRKPSPPPCPLHFSSHDPPRWPSEPIHRLEPHHASQPATKSFFSTSIRTADRAPSSHQSSITATTVPSFPLLLPKSSPPWPPPSTYATPHLPWLPLFSILPEIDPCLLPPSSSSPPITMQATA